MAHLRLNLSRLTAAALILSGGLLSCNARSGGGVVDDVVDGSVTRKDGGACEGLQCKVAACPAGSDTIVTGKVTAPNGEDPIRQALVYVPLFGTPTEFPQGVACEVCNSPMGGRSVTQAYTNLDGTFELRGVPAAPDTPIIVQKGRWRRSVTLSTTKCQRHELTVEQARLPRDRGEGTLPQMAVAVGDYDAIECVLRNVGVSGGEFTAPAQGGAVHLYDNEIPGGGGAPGGVNIKTLLGDLNQMLRYQLIFLNCSDTTNSETLLRDAKVKQNLVDYVSRGGRLYTTDWSYDYIQQPASFSPFICFNDDKPCTDLSPHGYQTATSPGKGGDVTPFTADVEVGTPQGRALADWLALIGIPGGKVPVMDLLPDWVLMRQTALDLTRYPSTTWMTGNVRGKRPMTVTFDYPVAPQACGKVLYSSYHTREHSSRTAFPRYCPSGKMIAQEHVLEFLIFEISSCVGPIG